MNRRDACRERATCFYKLHVVEQHERLQRCACTAARHGANFAGWRVKREHVRQWRRAFPDGVKRASVQVTASRLLIWRRSGVSFAREVAAGWVGGSGRAAKPAIEQPRGGEREVADLLR